jgi:hypothetical protein
MNRAPTDLGLNALWLVLTPFSIWLLKTIGDTNLHV